MRFTIGTVDGKTHHSKEFTQEEIQDFLDESGGYVGSGTMSDIHIDSVDEFIEIMNDMLKYDKRNDTQNFTMEMPSGISRHFNVQHIIWWEIG